MSAMPPKPKKATVTVGVSGYHRIYVDEEVEVDVDDLDTEELVAALETKGYRCIPPAPLVSATEPEYRMWEALHFGRDEELKRVAAEMVYERLGRIA